MVHYFYGENVIESRKALYNLLTVLNKSKCKVIYVDHKAFNEQILKNTLLNPSFFSEPQILLVESFSSFGTAQKKHLIEILLRFSGEIVFWEEKNAPPSSAIKKNFPGLSVRYFPQPKVLYKFLEAIAPKSQNNFLIYFDKLTREQPIDLVFYLLKQHIRNLVLYKYDPDMFKAYPSWRLNKIRFQAEQFNGSSLLSFYSELVELEFLNKSGKLPIELEIALVNKLAIL